MENEKIISVAHRPALESQYSQVTPWLGHQVRIFTEKDEHSEGHLVCGDCFGLMLPFK